jgi:hypothetical protein
MLGPSYGHMSACLASSPRPLGGSIKQTMILNDARVPPSLASFLMESRCRDPHRTSLERAFELAGAAAAPPWMISSNV